MPEKQPEMYLVEMFPELLREAVNLSSQYNDLVDIEGVEKEMKSGYNKASKKDVRGVVMPLYEFHKKINKIFSKAKDFLAKKLIKKNLDRKIFRVCIDKHGQFTFDEMYARLKKKKIKLTKDEFEGYLNHLHKGRLIELNGDLINVNYKKIAENITQAMLSASSFTDMKFSS